MQPLSSAWATASRWSGLSRKDRKGRSGFLIANSETWISLCFARCLPCHTLLMQKEERPPREPLPLPHGRSQTHDVRQTVEKLCTPGTVSYEFPKTPSLHLYWSGINCVVLCHLHDSGRRHEGPICFDVTDRFRSTNAPCYRPGTTSTRRVSH